MPPISRRTWFAVGYWILALIAVMAVQYVIATTQSVDQDDLGWPHPRRPSLSRQWIAMGTPTNTMAHKLNDTTAIAVRCASMRTPRGMNVVAPLMKLGRGRLSDRRQNVAAAVAG
jgi:hypothetical protein